MIGLTYTVKADFTNFASTPSSVHLGYEGEKAFITHLAPLHVAVDGKLGFIRWGLHDWSATRCLQRANAGPRTVNHNKTNLRGALPVVISQSARISRVLSPFGPGVVKGPGSRIAVADEQPQALQPLNVGD